MPQLAISCAQRPFNLMQGVSAISATFALQLAQKTFDLHRPSEHEPDKRSRSSSDILAEYPAIPSAHERGGGLQYCSPAGATVVTASVRAGHTGGLSLRRLRRELEALKRSNNSQILVRPAEDSACHSLNMRSPLRRCRKLQIGRCRTTCLSGISCSIPFRMTAPTARGAIMARSSSLRSIPMPLRRL